MDSQVEKYFRTLELDPGASLDELKIAWRELCKVWHPDRFPNDIKLQRKAQEKMKAINVAYEALVYIIGSETSATRQRTENYNQHNTTVHSADRKCSSTTLDNENITEIKIYDYCNEFRFLIFKYGKFGIGPCGILWPSPNWPFEWKNINWPLESITRVRWVIVRHYINGFPSSTSYKVGIGNKTEFKWNDLQKQQYYDEFLAHLWRLVCAKIINTMLNDMKNGKTINILGALIGDTGVEMYSSSIFKSNDKQLIPWNATFIDSKNGAMVINSPPGTKKYSTYCPYSEYDNINILEILVRQLQRTGVTKLSDLL